MPNSNKEEPVMQDVRINAKGTLIPNAAMIPLVAAKIVRPQPKKNPFKQNTNGTNK